MSFRNPLSFNLSKSLCNCHFVRIIFKSISISNTLKKWCQVTITQIYMDKLKFGGFLNNNTIDFYIKVLHTTIFARKIKDFMFFLRKSWSKHSTRIDIRIIQYINKIRSWLQLKNRKYPFKDQRTKKHSENLH